MANGRTHRCDGGHPCRCRAYSGHQCRHGAKRTNPGKAKRARRSDALRALSAQARRMPVPRAASYSLRRARRALARAIRSGKGL